jgi:hypothetical protein
MASIEHDVPVQLHIFGMPRQAAVARVRERDSAERTARALKGAGVCVGLAAVSILLPIAHFVLVPGFLIAAPFVALRRLREGASFVGLVGTCPRCNEERKFEAKGAFTPGLKTACPACSFAIEVEAEPAAGAAAPGA